ncbi:hypothetical protein QQ045_020241 [Rhodiola kirilowii]
MSSPPLNISGFSSLEPSHFATTIATVVILGLFFVSFVFLLFCRFIFEQASRSNSVYTTDSSSNSDGENNASGLDPVIRDMFPNFLYSAVKGWKEGLECAICLSDIEDDDMLRLLTVCCHVFHQKCIDMWLKTHTTCPICRSSLTNPEKHHIMCPLLQHSYLNENEQPGDHFDEESSRHDQVALTVHGHECGDGKKFPKAHSTGHSIVMVREDKDVDKYKLFLTAPVRAEIVKGHRCARSCTIFEEFSNNGSDKPNCSSGNSLPAW